MTNKILTNLRKQFSTYKSVLNNSKPYSEQIEP